MSARRYCITILFMGFAVLLSLASQAQANAQICQLHTAGMIISMRASIEVQIPADVAMQQAGLVPGGPLSRMADLAYRLLSTGNPEDVVRQRVQALCLTLGTAVLDDAPTFNTTVNGGGAQLCSDVAVSTAQFLIDDAHAPLEKVFAEYSDGQSVKILEDGRVLKKPVDAIKAAFTVGYKRAQQGGDKRAITSSVMAYCEALKPPARALLNQQFYIE